ncbi:MAG: spermidine/putrescine ABC transporter substrate-binding protein [Phototrophicales bacterium]|nr:spermidine/putrescine ABC transporter substrate-binding protein [Phototrophicales bacterium]
MIPFPKRHIFLFFILTMGVCLLIACTPNTPEPEAAAPNTLATSIRLHNWQDDMPQAIFDKFTEETGIQIELITYESQDEAIANLRNSEIYDVVVLNNEYVAVAIAEDRLMPLDYTLLTDFRNISPNFRDLAYDPQNQYSIPYNWGTFGIVVNPEKVTTPITRWEDLWNEEFIGKLVIWNGKRTTVGIALKALGYSPNTEDVGQLAQARSQLMALRPSVVAFVGASADMVTWLTTGDGAVAMGYVGDIFAAQAEGFTFDYILPEEGTLLWGDNFIIPKNSPNSYTAHVFVNFLLQPENAATILEYNYYSSPNEGVAELVSDELRNDSLIFPPNDVLQKASLLLALPVAVETRYTEIWQSFVEGTNP